MPRLPLGPEEQRKSLGFIRQTSIMQIIRNQNELNVQKTRSYFKTPFGGVLNIAGGKFEPVFVRISIPSLSLIRKP
jgi:hypothetical protein